MNCSPTCTPTCTPASTSGVLWVCVLGPSGAGKDSVLRWVHQHWSGPAPLHWARRSITRRADAGAEAHEALSQAEFAALRASGAFALHWSAHGLDYGLRWSELQPPGQQGGFVLFNGSRAHLAACPACYAHAALLHITANAATLTQRLLARAREDAAEVPARVARSLSLPPMDHPRMMTVGNDGALEQAAQQVLNWLKRGAPAAPPRPPQPHQPTRLSPTKLPANATAPAHPPRPR